MKGQLLKCLENFKKKQLLVSCYELFIELSSANDIADIFKKKTSRQVGVKISIFRLELIQLCCLLSLSSAASKVILECNFNKISLKSSY